MDIKHYQQQQQKRLSKVIQKGITQWIMISMDKIGKCPFQTKKVALCPIFQTN